MHAIQRRNILRNKITKGLAQLLILPIYITFLHCYMQHTYRTYLIKMYKNQNVEKCMCGSVKELKYVIRVEKLKSARKNARNSARENEEAKRCIYIDTTVRLCSHVPRTVQGSRAQRGHVVGLLGTSDKLRCSVRERQK